MIGGFGAGTGLSGLKYQNYESSRFPLAWSIPATLDPMIIGRHR